MKVGVRKVNVKNRVKARTTGKVKRAIKKSVNPITQKPVYEVEGTVVGYKDVPPAPRETFQFDDEAMELLKALGFES